MDEGFFLFRNKREPPAVTLVTMKTTQKLIGAVVASAAIMTGAAGLLAMSASAATPLTATTNLTQRPDSGSHGNWALDHLTRTVTLAAGSPTTPSLCGTPAPATCFAYTGTIDDKGTAYATTGAASPGAPGIPIKGTPTASVTGHASITFDASSDTPNATLVPASLAGGTPSTTSWAEQFFPAGTAFGNENLPTWTWTYTDAKNCQKWVDAFDNGQGALPANGDITGVDNCSTTVSPVGNQTVTVGQAASIQVFGATTSGNKTLAYAATGLPDGLSIDAATGLVSGTPKADAIGGTASVTVTDFGGVNTGTTFGVTVKPAPTAPAKVVLSHGKAIHISNTRENVSWQQSLPSWDKLTIVGPGPISGHVGYVQVKSSSGLGVITGLLAGHTYTVTIQPQTTKGGASAGNFGKIVFVTTHS